MTDQEKGRLIGEIISKLNEPLRAENKRLCSQRRHSEQKPLHGADMFFKLAFMNKSKIKKLAKECGLK